MALGVWFSQLWITELATHVGIVASIISVALIAYIPGLIVSFLALSLLLYRQPPFVADSASIPVTIVIAAWNEQESIAETLKYLAEQDHTGPMRIIVASNNSTDETAERALAAAAELGLNVDVIFEGKPGKCFALNTALAAVTDPLIMTLDADTVTHPQAVRRLVCRLEHAPDQVAAVAGAVMVKNGRDGFWAKMQEWDYFLGIAAVKRMQSSFQSTLVAQGAFSIYRTEKVRAVGGWPDAIGEDIVLTWRLMGFR